MVIVADTNIFLAVALEEPERPRIVEIAAGHELAAPQVLPFELGNAIIAMKRKGVLRPEEVMPCWNAVQAILVDLRPIDMHSALGLASRFGIYAYDAYFLECALGLRAPILTLDNQMKRVARELSIPVLE
jgi:predicted nucleic acid-binding protein